MKVITMFMFILTAIILLAIIIFVDNDKTVSTDNGTTVSADNSKKVKVIAAVDESAACIQVIDEGKPELCPAGSSITLYEMTLEEAEAKGIKDYVLMTSDPETNRQLGKHLADKINQRHTNRIK